MTVAQTHVVICFTRPMAKQRSGDEGACRVESANLSHSQMFTAKRPSANALPPGDRFTSCRADEGRRAAVVCRSDSIDRSRREIEYPHVRP